MTTPLTPDRPWACPDFEAALGDFRDGTLAAPASALARAHLEACPACADLLAAVAQAVAHVAALPQLEPPPRLLAAIFAQTLPPRQQHRPASAGFFASLWASITSPRFALAVAMSVFAVALLLNAAQVNLRQVSLSDLTPASLTSALQRHVDRAWARGVSYYRDLRVVYEIEAAIHQMRQAPAPAAAPADDHDRTQRPPRGVPHAQLALLALPPLPPPYRRFL
ncbi:MAG TPA: zf-HC2 domain-containing protein [Terriglobales bacterium]|nr:zf-HC2 domain-containing protein [Terriglobales bacterium]